MRNKPVLGILLGDAAGVGPEIVAKVAADGFFEEYCRPIIMGDLRVFQRGCKVAGVEVQTQVISDVSEATWKDGIPVLDQKDLNPDEVPFGQLNIQSGRACLNLLKLGIELFQEGKIDGFSFAPLNKAGMIRAGCKFESEHHYMAHAPTLSEIGDYEDVEVPVWRGVVASPEMSDEAVAYYSEILKKVSDSEEWKTDYIDKNKLISNYMDAAAAKEYMTQFEEDYLATLEAAKE